MNCEKCGKKFHYCGSCSPEECYENGFCSDECLENSDELKNYKEKGLTFYESLNSEQKDKFFEILNSTGYWMNRLYEWIYEYRKNSV